MKDAQCRETEQLFDTVIADTRRFEVQPLQMAQTSNVSQTSVGHCRSAQSQRVKLLKPRELSHAGVGHFRRAEIQNTQAGGQSIRVQRRVRDRRSGQVQRVEVQEPACTVERVVGNRGAVENNREWDARLRKRR